MASTDPVLDELIQCALEAAAEEGGLATLRAAGSPFLSASSGTACALFDLTGRQITQTAGGLMHVSALRLMHRELLKDFPLDAMHDGDVFVFNDHFRGGVHPADVAMFLPVFHDGRIVMFAAAMMIVTDIGGMSAGGLPANATEIFHEGLVIPPLKLREAGRRVPSLERLILANVRAAPKVLGDFDAIMVGINTARDRVKELLDRYGVAVVGEVIDRLIAHSRTMTGHSISELTDGTYRGEYTIEADGFDEREIFTIRCEIEVRGERCRIDFTGTDKQARGPVNASLSQSLSGAAYALRCYLDPFIPMNEGFYEACEFVFPEGSLLNPNYPAACNLRMGTVGGILGAVNRAFADAFPDRVTAGSSASITISAGAATGQGHADWALGDADLGVCGARQGLDGVDGTPHPLYSMPGWMRSVEGYELEFPIEYECLELQADSGGAGEWRGAAGIMKRVRFLADGWLTVRSSDGFAFGPAGIAGGKAGGLARFVLNEGRSDEVVLPPKKTNHFVKAGDVITMANAGGGGFGDPFKRDPDAVARDVRFGVVSREGALRDYGVEVNADASAGRSVTK